jgi:hypothetical protein
MKLYRSVWLSFCLLCGVTGAVGALALSLASVTALFVMAALTGAVAAMVALSPDDPLRLPKGRWRRVGSWTVLAGAASVAVVGLGSLVGGWTAALILAVAVGASPSLARRWMEWLHGPDHPQSLPRSAEPSISDDSDGIDAISSETFRPEEIAHQPLDPGLLSDDALCLAWRASFSPLQRADTPAQRLRIVTARSAYLEELARRNPDGVAAWLASGARAAGNPARFVTGDGAAGRASIDWDSLIQGTEK